MSLRNRLFLSFAVITMIAVVTAATGYVGFRWMSDRYHYLTASLLPNYAMISQMIDLARDLGDQPLAYAFAETEAERAPLRFAYRQTSDQFMDLVRRYIESDHVQLDDDLQATAQELVDRGSQFIRLVDQRTPLSELQEAKKSTEAAEAKFQDLLSDGTARIEHDLKDDVISQSEGAVVAWTLISMLGAILATVAMLYILSRFITRPIDQLKHSASGMAAGDYSRRVKVERMDEIGELAAAFNRMAEAVEKRQLALTDLNQALEARVQKRTEQLRQAKEQSESILNTTYDALVLVNQDYLVERTNPAFLKLFDYTEATVAGLSAERLVADSQHGVLVDVLRQAALQSDHTQLELRCRRRDGTEFIADAAFHVVNAEPYLKHLLCSFHDITVQKQAQQELEETLRKERELSAMKSGFVSLVSHEFRTPLSVIQSSAELMERYWDRLDESGRGERLTTIQAQVHLMVGFLEDFLTVNGTEMVGAKFAPVQLDVPQFARNLIDELQFALNTQSIHLSVQGEVLPFLADPKLLRQILVNLLTNAVKYSAPGDPVDVEIVGTPENLTIRIRDRGIGIPEEDQPHIFEPFHRGTNVGNITGTGLGLAIAKHAIEVHGGTISFQSIVGQGTTFTLVFPPVPFAEMA